MGATDAPPGPLVRPVRTADAEACLAIYAPIVTGTAISFEEDPPDADEMAARIARTTATHPWLVAEQDGDVLGYAYATVFRARPAYRWCCETSVYVATRARGRGVGSSLYERLLRDAAELGFAQAYGGITLPNPASVALHERHGFRFVGRFDRAGHKLGRWHAIGFWQRELVPGPPRPGGPARPEPTGSSPRAAADD